VAKTSAELEKEFIDTAREKTGRSLKEWLSLVGTSGIQKRNDVQDWLKKEQGLNHMQSQFIVGIYLNNGNPVYMDETNLLGSHFAKCPGMRMLFDEISTKIISLFHDTQLVPKKTYLSFTATREFVAINIMPNEIRLGLDLGDMPFDNIIQKSRLKGPMPRISHMVTITEINQFDQKFTNLIEESYKRTHHK